MGALWNSLEPMLLNTTCEKLSVWNCEKVRHCPDSLAGRTDVEGTTSSTCKVSRSILKVYKQRPWGWGKATWESWHLNTQGFERWIGLGQSKHGLKGHSGLCKNTHWQNIPDRKLLGENVFTLSEGKQVCFSNFPRKKSTSSPRRGQGRKFHHCVCRPTS